MIFMRVFRVTSFDETDGVRHSPGVWKTTVVQFDTDMVGEIFVSGFRAWTLGLITDTSHSLRRNLGRRKKYMKRGTSN